MSRKKEIQYQYFLEIFKASNPNGLSPTDLLTQMNLKLSTNNYPTIKERTLDYIIEDLRDGKFNHKPENIIFQNGKYTVEKHNLNFYLSELSDDQRNTMPFLYSILKKYQYIPSVNMFLSSLEEQLLRNNSINVQSAVISINNHQKLEYMEEQMILVKRLLKHIHHQEVIEISYQSTSEGIVLGRDDGAILNPLQIRQYLGKFYLVATSESNPLIIKTYLLDNIQKDKTGEYRLETVIDEEVEDELDSETIKTFDYDFINRKLNLETYFDDCIGIMRDHRLPAVPIRRWFKGWAATAVISSPLHHSQIHINPEKVFPDGRVLIQITVQDNVELQNHFARFGKYSWGVNEDEPNIDN